MDAADRLSRRAFVRGAALGTVAALAARPWTGGVARAGGSVGAFPALAVGDPVVGIAPFGGGLLAVGGRVGSARAWAAAPGAVAWRPTAGAEAFGVGTTLTAVGGRGPGAVAVGWAETGAGPRMAGFATDDGRGWRALDLPQDGPGIACAVASLDGQTLVVGATFDEPGVREPVRAVGFASDDGVRWRPVEGLPPLRHGSPTLLAAVDAGLLLGISGVAGVGLYLAETVAGPWRAVAAPGLDRPLALLAAAQLGDGVLLAGLDGLDRARYWIGGPEGWRATAAPPPLGRADRVAGLAARRGAVVAAGWMTSGSFVEEVSVR